ncbi:hypothetical protein IIA29_11025 [candidate division KSB1 bacterium]|nr:hypothetical protein [candidate division KSB1 bacterium]
MRTACKRRRRTAVRQYTCRFCQIAGADYERIEQLDFAKAADEKETVGEKLSFLHFHETYHLGQIGLLRRLAGKEGVIK